MDSYSLHKKSRVLNYNPGFSKYRRQQIQIDLVDIQKLANQNDGYHYLLTGIDTFTRFGFCEPLKNKKSNTVLNGFKRMMRTAVKYPNSVVSDSGSEFINTKFIEFCRNNSIKCSQNFTSVHAPYVERYNRSIKNKIYAFMDGNNTERFIDVLPDIINTYNNTIHRMIGLTPKEAEKKKITAKLEI